MTSNLQFFEELKEWSERKLNLIEKYLDGATRILGSINQVYYVDGFAGRGIYGRPGETPIPGSPLRAAQLAEKYATQGKPQALRCINIEIDVDTFLELQTVTSNYQAYVRNINGAFTASIDSILGEIGTKPAVCFLDPFGVDGIDWEAVQKLIRRNAQTDIWLRFDVGEVRRRDGWFGLPQNGADKHFEILTRTYGISDKDQLHSMLQGTDAEDNKLRAVKLYAERLMKEFKRAKGNGYAEFYRIGSLQEETKYYLVFATANKKGLVLASDVVYGIEEDYQRELERYRKTAPQLDMFSMLGVDPTPDEILAAKTTELVDEIRQNCRGKKLSRLDIHASVLANRFGVIKGTHITRALKQLIDEKAITTKTGQISDAQTEFLFA